MDDFKIQIQGAVLDNEIEKSIQNQLKNISNLSINIDKVNTTGIKKAIQKAIQDGYRNAPIGTLLSPQLKSGAASGKSQTSSSLEKQAARIKESLNTKLFDAQISELEADFRKLGLSADEAGQKIEEVRKAYEKLNSADSTEKIVSAHKNLNNELKKSKNELRIAKASTSEYVDAFKQIKLSNRIESWLNKNTAATKEAKNVLGMYLATLKSKSISPTQYNEIANAFEHINTQMRIQGKLGKGFFDSLKSNISKIKDLGIASNAAFTAYNKTKESLNELKEIDSILTEISKTSDLSAEKLKQLGNDSFEAASKYGRKASDYLTSVQEMNRSGFYNEQGNAMAEQSLLAQSAGDMTEEIADKWILATNAAYQYEGEAKKINAVLDGANNITNRNSVNMTDMAEAMSTVGTSASQAGVQVNELTAIVGTAVATTKKDGNEVGTALKALFTNLQNTSSSKITNTLDSANASMTTMKNGIEQMRTPIEILKDLSKTYNSLDEKDPLRSEITRNLGGKNHANILAAILANYSQYEKMLTDYSEGSGSAMEEAQKSADNWEGSLNRLSNTWTDMVGNIADSSSITAGINFFNDALRACEQLVDTIGLIPVAISAIYTVTKAKDKNGLGKALLDYIGVTEKLGGTKDYSLDITTKVDKTAFDALKAEIQACNTTVEIDTVIKEHKLENIEGLSEHIKELYKKGNLNQVTPDSINSFIQNQNYSNIADVAHGFNGVNTAIKEYNKVVLNSTQDTDKFINAISKSNPKLADCMKNFKTGSMSMTDYGFSLATATIKTFALEAASMALNAAISMGVSVAIQALISGISYLINYEAEQEKAFEKAKTATEEAAKSIRELKSEMADTSSKANELSSEFANLVQGVNPLTNENKSLSTEKYERFLDVNNQLAKLFPSLTKNYDKNGNAILGLSGDVDTVTASIAKLVEQQNNLAKADIRKHLDEYVNGTDDNEGVFKALEGYKKDVQDAESELKSLQNTYDNIINQQGTKSLYFYKYNDYLDDIKAKFGQEVYNALYNATTQNEDIQGNILYTIDFSKLELDDSTKSKITESYNTFYQDLQTSLSIKTSELETKNQEMSDQMMVWVEDLSLYKNGGDSFQKAISTMIGSIQWSDMDVEEGNIDEAKQLIQSLVLTPLSVACNNPDSKLEVVNAIQSLFTLNVEDMNVDDARAKIQEFCSILAKLFNRSLADVQELFGFGDFFTTAANYDNVVAYASNGSYKSASNVKNSKGFDQQSVIQAMNDNGINTHDEINKWKEILGTVNTLDEAIQKYKAQTESSDKTTISTFDKAWKSIDKTGTDEQKKSAKEAKEQLLELAKAGKLTAKEFQKSSIAEDIMKNTGLEAKEATKEVNKLAESTKQLSTMRIGITAITSAYDEKKDSKKKVVSASTLESMGDTLGVESWSPKNQEVWENYKNIAGDSSKSLKELKTAQDQLATSFVNSNNFLSNLNSTNKDYYTGLLEEMGVLNAKSIVEQALIANEDEIITKKIDNKLATIDIVNNTDSEIAGLGNEITALYDSSKALGFYVLKKQLANSNALSTSDSIKNLIALAKQCGYTGKAIQLLTAMENNQTQLEALKNSKDRHAPDTAAIIESNQKGLKAELDELLKSKPKLGKIGTTDGNKSNNSSSKNKSKSSKSGNTKQEIDWIARSIDRTTAKVDLLSAKLQNLFSVKAKNKNLNSQIKQTTKLINSYGKAVTKYTKKANSVKLSSSLKKLVQNGKITKKTSYKKLIKEYDEKTASKIQKYQDYYDKAQEAKRNKAAQKTARRELEQQKYQNYVDLYDTRIASAEAKEAKEIGYKNENGAVDTQIKNLKLSYQYQKEIANLTGNKAEYDKLEYEMQKKIAELKLQQIQNIQKDYENRIGLVDNDIQDIDNSISLAQARGQIVTAGYYRNLNKQQTDKRSKAVAEQKAIQAQLEKDLKEKTIKKGSDEWYEVQSTLQALDNTINECDVAIAENTTAIREVHTALLEAKAQNASNMNTEADFIAALLSRNELTDSDTGTMTSAGLGTLGTYGINLEVAQSQIREWNKERDILESMKKSGSLDYGDGIHRYNSSNELDDAYNAIIEKQQEWVKNEFDAEQKIIDFMKEYYQAQLDYMKEIIDAKKEALDYEKDLYDYQRRIADKTKNIATLEKQLAALQGDNSEEGRARRTQIQLSLDEANQDLQDTEYDKYISDQQNMLDNLMAEYEDLMNNLFKDTDALLRQGIDAINNNATLIQGILNKTVADYGYNYSGNFQDIINEFKQGGVVTGIKESLYKDTSSIASILDAQNKYLEQKYGENTSGNDSGGNKGGNSDNKDGQYVFTSTDGSKVTGGYNDVWSSGGSTAQEEQARKNAESFIKSNKQKANKKWAEYSDLNKKIYDKTGGYVLSTANMKELASLLGVKYNNAKSTGNLYQRLKALGVKGFRTGGIVRANGFPSDGDYVPIRVNPNETVLTQDFTNMLPTAVDIMDRFVKVHGFPNTSVLPQSSLGNQTFGDIVIHAELPNVHNAQDFVHALQSDTKLQKAFTIATKDLMNKGRITSNIQKAII